MKQILLSIFIFGASLLSSAQSLSFRGNDRNVIAVIPEKNTGLDVIYVAYGTDNLDATFSYSGQNVPKWYRYSNLGGGFAEEIENVENIAGNSTLKGIKAGYGYIVEVGARRNYFYLVNYLDHPLKLESISVDSEQDCGATMLTLSGEGTPLVYYTINGQQRSLDRGLSLIYETEEWDGSRKEYTKKKVIKNLANFTEHISVTPPAYCSTFFTLRGDTFLMQWGMDQSCESSVLSPKAIEVKTEAEEEGRTSTDEEDIKSNEITGNGENLGGSAPCEINFYAWGTEGVIHNEWQIATDSDFENITYRINERDLNFIFREEGTVYVRFVGSNSDGSCEAYGDVYTVEIGASELYCPNAFSPGASEGVNDEWKVSYKSIVDFECWIFDRYGTQMCHFTDPSKGWDGRYRGKLVKPGVYYYIIQATGSEGKKYKKSGDINIVRYKSYSGPVDTE